LNPVAVFKDIYQDCLCEDIGEMTCAKEYTIIIRPFNFNFDEYITKTMQDYMERICPPGNDMTKDIVNSIDEVLKSGTFPYARLNKTVITDKKFYTVVPEKKYFSFSGRYINNAKKILGDDCEIFLPTVCIVGYALAKDKKYIVMFSPEIGDELNITEETKEEKTDDLDDNNLW